MKLSPRDADGYFARPDPARTGLLIYGADAMRVALKRQQLISTLLGPNAEEEMRLTRMAGTDLRKDPAQLLDAVKAVGFFPGPRVAFVEDANDAAVSAVSSALEDWIEGDAQIVITAGQLKPGSKLRKLFEAHPNSYAVGIYDAPPSRAEIEGLLKQAGIENAGADALTALSDISRDIGPGDLAQLVDKIALYKLGDPVPLEPADIDACAPQSSEAALDDILNVVAEARHSEIGPLVRRLQAQGANPVSLCIGATRHFRTLYAVASDPGGAAAGAGKLRPPVFGPRRDRIIRQVQSWGPIKLEKALTLLTDTDLLLRSAAQTAPAAAVVERTLIRLAILAGKR